MKAAKKLLLLGGFSALVVAATYVGVKMVGPSRADPVQAPQEALILAGVSKGFNISVEQQCFQGAKAEVGDVEAAVRLLQERDSHDVLQGLEQLADALAAAPALARTCASIKDDPAVQQRVQQLEQAVEMMHHPEAFVAHIGKDLLVNGKDIYADVQGAVAAYNAKQWERFGEEVGDALTKILEPAQVGPIPEAAHVQDAPEPNWVLVIQGVTEGFGLPLEEACIQSSTTEIEDIKVAVADFRKHDPKDIVQGLKTLGGALQDVPTMMSECKKAMEDAKTESAELEKALKSMKGPVSLVFHVGKNLILNGVEIYHSVSSAVSAYDGQQWAVFGYNMGAALRKLLIGGATGTLPLDPKDWKPIQWKEVPHGIFETLKAKADGDFVVEASCLKAGTSDWTGIDDAIQTVVNGKNTHDVNKVIDGLVQLATALKPLPDLLRQCKGAEADVAKLVEALEKMKTPAKIFVTIGEDILHHLVVNGVDIYSQVLQGIRDRAAGNGEALGHDLGEILADVFLPDTKAVVASGSSSSSSSASSAARPAAAPAAVPAAAPAAAPSSVPAAPSAAPASQEPDWAVVLQGVSTGFGLTLEAACFKGAVGEVEDVQAAVALFHKGGKEGFVKGLEQLAGALKGIPPLVKQCKSAMKDAETQSAALEQALKAMKGPVSLVLHVGKDLLLNGVDIFTEVHASITAFDQQDWANFGVDVGTALRKLLIGGATDPLPLDPKDWKPIQWNEVPVGIVEMLREKAEGTFSAETSCIRDAKGDYSAIDAAVMAIVAGKRAGNVTEVKDGLVQLATALKPLPDLLRQCKAAEADVAKLAQALAKMGTPEQVAIEIGKDLLHNLLVDGIDIFNHVLQGIRDRAAGNGEALGNDLGDILADVFFPAQAQAVIV